MAMSKVQQQKTLDEGLALGVAMLGIESVRWETVSTESDFRRAWLSWPHSHLFPALNFKLSRNDLRQILRMSPRRVGARLSGWSGSGPYAPWTDDDDYAVIAEILHEDISVGDWRALAANWLGVDDA